jgi:chloramphenicol 3-O phosphotransferase
VTGRAIFLNGASGAGKTTLARAIQEISDVPFLYTGIDSQFAMVPPKWGSRGSLETEGFRYVPGQADGHRLVRIEYGSAGEKMLAAMHQATGALVAAGADVIIDEMLLKPELMTSWQRVLRGVGVLFVAVDCPLEVLEVREVGRRNPPGLARGHLPTVHAHTQPYDMRVDTSVTTTDDAASAIMRLASRSWG